MEDAFQRVKRLVTRGSQSKAVDLDRLYHKLTKTSPCTFPNVGQACVTTNELESTQMANRHLATTDVIAPLNAGRLAKRAFRPNPQQHWLRKPVSGHRTCRASAFSQQVGLEECLLQSQLAPLAAHRVVSHDIVDPCFTDLRYLQKSWACGLVRTVAETAVNLLHPYVIASESEGALWLVVCSLGRCLLGWPLRLVSEEERFFQPETTMTRDKLRRIIVTDPFSKDEYVNVPVEVAFCKEQVGYRVTGAPRSVLEAAAVKGFTQVAKTALDFTLREFSLPTPSELPKKAGLLIEAFRAEWRWTPADVARAMQHTLPGFRESSHHQPSVQQSPDIPAELRELALAMQEADDAEKVMRAQVEGPNLGPRLDESTISLPGVGPVSQYLLQALTSPAPPPHASGPRKRGGFARRSAQAIKRARHRANGEEAVEPAVAGDAAAELAVDAPAAPSRHGDDDAASDGTPIPHRHGDTDEDALLDGSAEVANLAADEAANEAAAEEVAPDEAEITAALAVELAVALSVPAASADGEGVVPASGGVVPAAAAGEAPALREDAEEAISRSHISGIELAKSGRSRCKVCDEIIPLRAPRICIYYSTSRYEGKVHPHCIAGFHEISKEDMIKDINRLAPTEGVLWEAAYEAVAILQADD